MTADRVEDPAEPVPDGTEALASFLMRELGRLPELVSLSPRAVLPIARTGAEGICREVYRAGVGPPGRKIMLDELIRKLLDHKLVPLRVAVPLGTVQAYGNYGSHAGELAEITAEFLVPCLVALAQVVRWYFVEAQGEAVPPTIEAALAGPRGPVAPSASVTGVVATVMTGSAMGARCIVPPGRPLTVGRSLSADLRLPEDDRKVSRNHITLATLAEGVVVRDLDSKNPPLVDGVRLGSGSTALVHHGSTVRVGRTLLRIEVEGGVPLPAATETEGLDDEPAATETDHVLGIQ